MAGAVGRVLRVLGPSGFILYTLYFISAVGRVLRVLVPSGFILYTLYFIGAVGRVLRVLGPSGLGARAGPRWRLPAGTYKL